MIYSKLNVSFFSNAWFFISHIKRRHIPDIEIRNLAVVGTLYRSSPLYYKCQNNCLSAFVSSFAFRHPISVFPLIIVFLMCVSFKVLVNVVLFL
jgi:hypothetical protein